MLESGRKSLMWDIRKSLLTLSAGELLHIAKGMGPVSDRDHSELQEGDQEDCFDYICSLYSKHLIESEDGGMVELLVLKDAIDDVIKNRDVVLPVSDLELHASQTPTNTTQTTYTTDDTATKSHQTLTGATTGGTTTHMFQAIAANPPVPTNSTYSGKYSETCSANPVSPMLPKAASDDPNAELLEMLTSYEELGRKLRLTIVPSITQVPQTPQHPVMSSAQASNSYRDGSDNNLPSRSVAQPIREGMISLRDLSYLQRREFKVQGGQVGDHSSDISYNNICKQIEEGIKEGFHDTEVVRSVLKIIKPGTFKDMLNSKDDLTMQELKGFLRAHLREKNSTELFQELMCAKQEENETPQQFLYRVIGLKQRVLFTSKLSDASIKYSAATIQDVRR